MKGKGGKKNLGEKEKKLPTYMISSADLKSRYVFRCDIAYDFDITLEDVEEDTRQYHCDHSYSFLRRNERLKYPYCPQPPTTNDSQTFSECQKELAIFNDRKKYVEGCHVSANYTAVAHYWLVKSMLHVDNWYFISDDDSMLENSIFRVFSDKFCDGKALYFTCQTDKTLTLEEAGKMAFQTRNELKEWARYHNCDKYSLYDIACKKLESDLSNHEFYDYKIINGMKVPIKGKNPISHPLPDKDEGVRYISLINYTLPMSSNELANLMIDVNSRAINNFFQEIRRRISVLERPLTTARGEGKSYIYANYNPRYAQYLVTIFRTFYNFCFTKKIGGAELTPAQRLGIADKLYSIEDIIYFR